MLRIVHALVHWRPGCLSRRAVVPSSASFNPPTVQPPFLPRRRVRTILPSGSPAAAGLESTTGHGTRSTPVGVHRGGTTRPSPRPRPVKSPRLLGSVKGPAAASKGATLNAGPAAHREHRARWTGARRHVRVAGSRTVPQALHLLFSLRLAHSGAGAPPTDTRLCSTPGPVSPPSAVNAPYHPSNSTSISITPRWALGSGGCRQSYVTNRANHF